MDEPLFSQNQETATPPERVDAGPHIPSLQGPHSPSPANLEHYEDFNTFTHEATYMGV